MRCVELIKVLIYIIITLLLQSGLLTNIMVTQVTCVSSSWSLESLPGLPHNSISKLGFITSLNVAVVIYFLIILELFINN